MKWNENEKDAVPQRWSSLAKCFTTATSKKTV